MGWFNKWQPSEIWFSLSRKIVQVHVVPNPVNDIPCLIALADDGTLWEGEGTPEELVWHKLPSLPDQEAGTGAEVKEKE